MSFRQTGGNEKPNNTLLTYTIRLYRVKKICSLLLLDSLFSRFILHYQSHYHYHYHYHHHYQILILIPYQYNSEFLYFISHIYSLKIFGGDIFHMRKEQNLELLLINIYVVFFLLVHFQTVFYYKNLQLYFLHTLFCFYVFIIITISRFDVKVYFQ